MRLQKRILLFVAVLLAAAGPAAAQMPKIDPEQRQLVLAASATLTMQQELDQAASQGFRVVMATARGNSEILLLL